MFEPRAGVCSRPAGVTGNVELKMEPVTKTALALAAMELTAVWPEPTKVRKTRLSCESSLATKEFVELSAAAGKGTPEVPLRAPLVLVPVM